MISFPVLLLLITVIKFSAALQQLSMLQILTSGSQQLGTGPVTSLYLSTADFISFDENAALDFYFLRGGIEFTPQNTLIMQQR